jgi:L-seryl-tRNA(Ser) seleniumtransferase
MSAFSGLPQVERVLSDPGVVSWIEVLSRPLVKKIVTTAIGELRGRAAAGERVPPPADIVAAVAGACRQAARRRLARVVNATGILLHTNLGRAPLPAEVWAAAQPANTAYSNLELELESGRRGGRGGLVPELISLLVGSEDALVVNNNAAAVLLLLSVLARGREVIVSRGEQVQIGGGFRIPEILALSGARLVEVGTTNITRLADYRRALRPETAMVLVVHSSNFRIRGFTGRPAPAEIARALPEGVILAVDQGSGVTTEDLPGERRAGEYLRQGAHLVCFSGDKVLGGPQAGIVAGSRRLVHRLARHPLMRAFRPGKTVYALLQEILVRKLNGAGAGHVGRLLAVPLEELRRRGERLLEGIDPARAGLVPATSTVGGGSAPDEAFPSLAVELRPAAAAGELQARLRRGDPPIIATVRKDRVYLNLATILPGDVEPVRAYLLEVLRGE